MKCPNCGFEQPDGSTDCQRCQVVFSKFRDRQERRVSHTSDNPSSAIPRHPGNSEPFLGQNVKVQGTQETKEVNRTVNIAGWVLAFGFWFVWDTVAPNASWWTGFLICIAIIAIGETLCRYILASR